MYCICECIYTHKKGRVSINLRYKVSKIESIRADKIPQSEPALLQHIMKMKWQVN